jgi:aconitate hydratase
VLSGNRNFEARIHPNLKANFLASPPLVVAYAIAGSVNRDLMTSRSARARAAGTCVPRRHLAGSDEIYALMKHAMNPQGVPKNYAKVKSEPGKLWDRIEGVDRGQVYDWPKSTYIAEPPFFDGLQRCSPLALVLRRQGRARDGLFGDSITTDHISPGRQLPRRRRRPAATSPRQGVLKADFNSYGARRGNHE